MCLNASAEALVGIFPFFEAKDLFETRRRRRGGAVAMEIAFEQERKARTEQQDESLIAGDGKREGTKVLR